jgi:hypothetical protein
MKSFSRFFALAAVPVLAIAAYATEAQAQVVYYPPSAYIAAYSPYYYNGYAHYLYRNNWYYRDHGAWRGYAHEPGELRGQRGGWGAHRWGGGGFHGGRR